MPAMFAGVDRDVGSGMASSGVLEKGDITWSLFPSLRGTKPIKHLGLFFF